MRFLPSYWNKQRRVAERGALFLSRMRKLSSRFSPMKAERTSKEKLSRQVWRRARGWHWPWRRAERAERGEGAPWPNFPLREKKRLSTQVKRREITDAGWRWWPPHDAESGHVGVPDHLFIHPGPLTWHSLQYYVCHPIWTRSLLTPKMNYTERVNKCVKQN